MALDRCILQLICLCFNQFLEDAYNSVILKPLISLITTPEQHFPTIHLMKSASYAPASYHLSLALTGASPPPKTTSSYAPDMVSNTQLFLCLYSARRH